MLYQVLDDSGQALDAHFELDGQDILFHSRGGAIGRNHRNASYGPALRLLLRRIDEAKLPLQGIWVDSSRVQHLPFDQRLILGELETGQPPERIFTLLSSRMKNVGRPVGAKPAEGNPNKRLRIRIGQALSDMDTQRLLGAQPKRHTDRHIERLPAEMLAKVTAEHIWNAVQALSIGRVQHAYGDSTGFDLLTGGGRRLPPKAVFGIAASEALGFEVQPKHFTAGRGTPCFKILASAGYRIVRKDSDPALTGRAQVSPDQDWLEGGKKLVMHLVSERDASLSPAKKAAFIRQYGRLYCERCGFEPAKHYDFEVADSCIEVHHHSVQVKDMKRDHKTKLDDLECLCANCHRVTHRELRQKLS